MDLGGSRLRSRLLPDLQREQAFIGGVKTLAQIGAVGSLGLELAAQDLFDGAAVGLRDVGGLRGFPPQRVEARALGLKQGVALGLRRESRLELFARARLPCLKMHLVFLRARGFAQGAVLLLEDQSARASSSSPVTSQPGLRAGRPQPGPFDGRHGAAASSGPTARRAASAESPGFPPPRPAVGGAAGRMPHEPPHLTAPSATSPLALSARASRSSSGRSSPSSDCGLRRILTPGGPGQIAQDAVETPGAPQAGPHSRMGRPPANGADKWTTLKSRRRKSLRTSAPTPAPAKAKYLLAPPGTRLRSWPGSAAFHLPPRPGAAFDLAQTPGSTAPSFRLHTAARRPGSGLREAEASSAEPEARWLKRMVSVSGVSPARPASRRRSRARRKSALAQYGRGHAEPLPEIAGRAPATSSAAGLPRSPLAAAARRAGGQLCAQGARAAHESPRHTSAAGTARRLLTTPRASPTAAKADFQAGRIEARRMLRRRAGKRRCGKAAEGAGRPPGPGRRPEPSPG